MKQQLLGSLLGQIALSLRDKGELLHTAYFHLEKVGVLANDQLATILATRLCQSQRTFIDVGAHIGSIISTVKHVDASINIIAIEAVPEKVTRLQRKFPSVEFHNCAVGESTGEVSFFINLKQSGYSSLDQSKNVKAEDISEINVPMKRLDDIISATDVDVVKIDVEGAELGALRGGTQLLNSSRPTIMFESAPQKDTALGYTKQELHQFFRAHEYTVLIPNRVAHNDDGLSEAGFIESHLYPRRTTNYFAIAKERRREIREKARSILKIS